MAGSPVHTGSLGTSVVPLAWVLSVEASGTWSRAARTHPAGSGCEEAWRYVLVLHACILSQMTHV